MVLFDKLPVVALGVLQRVGRHQAEHLGEAVFRQLVSGGRAAYPRPPHFFFCHWLRRFDRGGRRRGVLEQILRVLPRIFMQFPVPDEIPRVERFLEPEAGGGHEEPEGQRTLADAIPQHQTCQQHDARLDPQVPVSPKGGTGRLPCPAQQSQRMGRAGIVVMRTGAVKLARESRYEMRHIKDDGGKAGQAQKPVARPRPRCVPRVNAKEREGPRKREEHAFRTEVGVAERTAEKDDHRHGNAVQHRAQNRNPQWRRF